MSNEGTSTLHLYVTIISIDPIFNLRKFCLANNLCFTTSFNPMRNEIYKKKEREKRKNLVGRQKTDQRNLLSLKMEKGKKKTNGLHDAVYIIMHFVGFEWGKNIDLAVKCPDGCNNLEWNYLVGSGNRAADDINLGLFHLNQSVVGPIRGLGSDLWKRVISRGW